MTTTLKADWTAPELSAHTPGDPLAPEALPGLLDKAGKGLADTPAQEIIAAFDALSGSLLRRDNPLRSRHPEAGLPFLGDFCRGEHIAAMVADSLGGLECLDRFTARPFLPGREIRAYPRGVVVHWLAGNLPSLGILSLFSAMMTKNASLVRVPRADKGLLADLMAHLHGLGEVPARLAGSVLLVRYDRDDQASARAVSLAADARIIWGGDESTAAVKALPCKPTCLDLVFPDRTSFAILGPSAYAPERAAATARLIAHDASVFEQKACASPHTVFLSKATDKDLDEFGLLLKQAMRDMLSTIPKTAPSPREASAILNLRGQYDMFHQAWYSDGLEFSVLSDKEPRLGPPIGNRTLFVRRLPDDEALVAALPPNVQSVGLAAEGEEFERLTETLGRAGVHRFVPLGAMTRFELPWDGLSIPQCLVRWTSRQAVPGEGRS